MRIKLKRLLVTTTFVLLWTFTFIYVSFKWNKTNKNHETNNDITIKRNTNSHKTESNDYYLKSLPNKLHDDIKDLLYYVNANNDDRNFKQNLNVRIKFLLAQYYNYSNVDEISVTALELSNYVKNQISKNQNTLDCTNNNKIICDIDEMQCGFGCQMHCLLDCFIESYFKQKTLVVYSKGWTYNSGGYEELFLPVSETCRLNSSISKESLKMRTRKPADFYSPLNVPEDIMDKLKSFHGNPFVWWVGHLLSYLMRFQPHFEETIKENIEKMGFETPCVGVHVRRTDKISEAAFHNLTEYMVFVDEFFDIYELRYPNRKFKRIVYLATDEKKVIDEAVNNYTDYKILYSEGSESTLENRYSTESLKRTLFDVHMLSQCDYLVCTFSSNVCRMAYELMQIRYTDASWRFKSLDDIYYFDGQHPHLIVAIQDHIPESIEEIELKIGDSIHIYGNHWNGFSKGENIRTGLIGLFPSYKVKDVFKFAKIN